MNRLRLALLIAALIAAPHTPFGADAFAQAQTRPAPTGLALEVTYLKGRPPSYKVVPPPGSGPRGGWHALYGRVPGWRPPAGSLPTRAVNVVTQPEGEQVRVIVSVYQGERFHDKETSVSTHLLRVGESVEVGELKRFGVEPFVIKVVRVAPQTTNPPALLSQAPSIVLTGAAHVGDSTLPAHRVSVQNLSAKDVVALGVQVRVGGREEGRMIKQGRDGERLMAGGGTYEFELMGASEARPAAEGYAPAAPPDQEIHITAAVFADGSAEGDARTAASFRAFVYGRRAQIARLLPLFREALAGTDEDGAAAAKRFHERVSALDNTAEASDVEALRREFPTLDRGTDLKTAMEVAMNGVRYDLLKELEKFVPSDAGQPGVRPFRAWLGASKERLERWLARL